jgi:CRP-like cAMP-binding protein
MRMFRSATDHEESYTDGQVIVREGEDGREMYVIQRGEAVVTKTVEGREVEIARLKRGDFFGEMSLLESQPRYATVRAVGDAAALVIKPGALLLKIRRNPTFAFEMLQQMSRRLRVINDKLVEMIGDGTIPEEASRQLDPIRIFTGSGGNAAKAPETPR